MLCFIPLTACIHHLHISGHAAPDIMTVSSFHEDPYPPFDYNLCMSELFTAFNTCSRPFMEDAHSDITLRPAVN